jgi:hypothetical protein
VGGEKGENGARKNIIDGDMDIGPLYFDISVPPLRLLCYFLGSFRRFTVLGDYYPVHHAFQDQFLLSSN